MALRVGGLKALARRVMMPQSLIPTRGAGCGPIAFRKPPTVPLGEEDELTWDDGSVNPEPALDQFNMVTKYEALGMLAMGMGLFGAIGLAARYMDKPSKKPFAPKEFPFDGLRVELGGDPNGK